MIHRRPAVYNLHPTRLPLPHRRVRGWFHGRGAARECRSAWAEVRFCPLARARGGARHGEDDDGMRAHMAGSCTCRYRSLSPRHRHPNHARPCPSRRCPAAAPPGHDPRYRSHVRVARFIPAVADGNSGRGWVVTYGYRDTRRPSSRCSVSAHLWRFRENCCRVGRVSARPGSTGLAGWHPSTRRSLLYCTVLQGMRMWVGTDGHCLPRPRCSPLHRLV